MSELVKMPRELETLFAGRGFTERHGSALPFVTVDPGGFPRAALLSFGEVRAHSGKELAVAVKTRSHTAANLIRRQQAMLYYLGRNYCAFVQARVGRGRACDCDPERQIFPLAVFRVKVDEPGLEEGEVEVLTGPLFSATDPDRIFSQPLFDELGKADAL
jgi:hypothetical protein